VSDTRARKQCRLTLAKKHLYTRSLSFLLQKNSNLTEVLNKKYFFRNYRFTENNYYFPFWGERRILLTHQAGLMDQIVRRYTPSPKMCLVTEKATNSKPTKLNLQQMSGSFKILAIGLTVSFICFIAEMVWSKLSRILFDIQFRRNYRCGCVSNCTCIRK